MSYPRFVVALLLLFVCGAASADQIYVRNKPFKGFSEGNPANLGELQVELAPLVEALGLHLENVTGNWVVTPEGQRAVVPAGVQTRGKLYIGNQEVDLRQVGDKTMVPLKLFAQHVGALVKYNKDLGTVDVWWENNAQSAGNWGPSSKGYRLIYFGADDAPACRHFRPILGRFEKKNGLPIVYVDVKKRSSENYKDYIYLYSGTYIPLTILINDENRPVKKWTGSIALDKFTSEVRAALR